MDKIHQEKFRQNSPGYEPHKVQKCESIDKKSRIKKGLCWTKKIVARMIAVLKLKVTQLNIIKYMHTISLIESEYARYMKHL